MNGVCPRCLAPTGWDKPGLGPLCAACQAKRLEAMRARQAAAEADGVGGQSCPVDPDGKYLPPGDGIVICHRGRADGRVIRSSAPFS